VSSTDREIRAPNGAAIDHVVQTDAAINPGNSGGPLLDGEGRVIGVNSQGRADGSGIAFAVPVDTLKRVLPALRSGRRVQRPYLGVSLAGRAARVVDAVRGGPAADAGLRTGDVVVSIDGRAVRSASEVAGAVQRHRVGDRVALVVRRGQRRLTLRVTLGARP
jgi:putative serine protease PepD